MPSYLIILSWALNEVGGVSQVVENLMKQIDHHRDYNPLLMVNSWADRIVRKSVINRRLHHFFRIRSIFNYQKPLKNLIAFLAFLPKELLTLLRFFQTHQVSVVNVHYCGLFALNISILKALRLYRGKLILSFHGRYVFTARQGNQFERLLWKLLLRSADGIVTCSEALKSEVGALDESCFSKITVIHNGVDMQALNRERHVQLHQDALMGNRTILLNVATFEYHKGHDVLIKAFANIEQEFTDVDLVLIGRSEGSLVSLRKLIREMGIENRVFIFESLPHCKVGKFYEKASIFILPSRYEPFGIVILEAGAFGTPVIASNVGGIREILTHDQTGRLCEPEDINCLSHELTYLLNHPEERQRLGCNLKKHVLDHFSWEVAYRKYMKCISG